MKKFDPYLISSSAMASILSAGCIFALTFVLGGSLALYQSVLAALFTLVVTFALVYILVKKIIYDKARDHFKKIALEEVRRDEGIAAHRRIGIVEVFDNFAAAKEEILDELESSECASVFIQLGRSLLRPNATFREFLERIDNQDGTIRILYANEDSPYLDMTSAANRARCGEGQPTTIFQGWQRDLGYVASAIEELNAQRASNLRRGKIEERQHDEGFLWRLFLADEFAYVQPYLFGENNAVQSPVLKLAKYHEGEKSKGENPYSLFRTFQEHFEQKWRENAEREVSLIDITRGRKTAVAAIIRFAQFNIFAIPKRYVDEDNEVLTFHCFGGKVQEGESFLGALVREIREELGLKAEVFSSSKTRHFHGAILKGALPISDAVKPWGIYTRSSSDDPAFDSSSIDHVIIYEVEISEAHQLSDLTPRREIVALLALTDAEIERMYRTLTPVSELEDVIDGSRITFIGDELEEAPGDERAKYRFKENKDRKLSPKGAALVYIGEKRKWNSKLKNREKTLQ